MTDPTFLSSQRKILPGNPAQDAFSRLRVSSPAQIFDNKNIYNRNESSWAEEVSGGGVISHLPNEAAVQLQVGTASGDIAIRQTLRYFAYVPGKSHLIVMTGVLGAPKANVVQRLGYYDDSNGLFFEQDENNLKLVRRSSASGSVVDTPFNQADWNLDKLDGTGPSKIIIDPTKVQIFMIDAQWLGSGRVRFGFSMNGTIIYCHAVDHSNEVDTAYTATFTLPVRYEIENTGVSASATNLKEICSSVASEAGFRFPGFEFTAGNGATLRTGITVRTPIFAVRLLDSFNSKENRRTLKLLKYALYAKTNDVFFEVAHLDSPSGITLPGWVSRGAGSGAEFSTSLTGITGNSEHVIDPSYVSTGQGQLGGTLAQDAGFVQRHSFVSQNKDSDNSEAFVVYATPLAGTADVGAALTWVEFD